MNKKNAENDIMMFIEGIYEPSIISIFEKEKGNLKPFILLNIEGINFLITNKKRFIEVINKYKNQIKKIGIEKKWISLYTEKKVIKYEIIPTNLKMKNI